MSGLDDFVQQGWRDHEEDSAGVMARFGDGIALVEEEAQLPALAGLITHVAGEHLARWADGIALLEKLTQLPVYSPESAPGRAVVRGQATLHLCAGDAERSDALEALAIDPAFPPASTRIRIRAVACSALVQQADTTVALELAREVLDLAAYCPGSGDPAARSLAITGNNLACTLEEKQGRSPDEDALLELAARAGRTYWEVAGTWTNVERAEYRLAKTYLALGRAPDALEHAAACLQICEANEAGAGELFFAREALALARAASADPTGAAEERSQAAACLEKLEGGLKGYCSGELQKLDAVIRAPAG